MSRILDRAGVFKALPIKWGVQTTDGSLSVALVIEFLIVAQMVDGEWADWSEYEDHNITGWFYFVKRDGTINTRTVDDLVTSIGWDGNVGAVLNDPKPIVCQITVAEDEYNGKTKLKVQWINPEGYSPGLATADPAQVSQISTKFGPLLRAAAAAAKAKTPTAKAQPPVQRAQPEPQTVPHTADVTEKDDLPF